MAKIAGFSDVGSGADTETEGHARKKTTSPKKSKKLAYLKAYGPGKTISDSEFSGMDEVPEPPRRSTRKSPTKAAAAAPTPASSKRAKSPTKATAATKPLIKATAAHPTPASPDKAKRGRPVGPKAAAAMNEPAPPRRMSPRKKIIADSPPPEDKLDPFPPKRAPMTVSDKPAVINRYGEKVPAPVDPDQRLRQAINFLSDEGPENCIDFEKKLDILEKWLRKNHPNYDGIIPGGKENDTENLCRRVEYMIWIHRNRLEEGAEQWYTRDMHPGSSMVKDIKPREGDSWYLTPDGKQIGAPMQPKLQIMAAEDRERRIAAAAAAAKKPATRSRSVSPVKRGAAAAAAASESQDSEMPHKEIWNRHAAARYPFGETPYMAKIESDRINADLARGKFYSAHCPYLLTTT
jgi:hypothetical protein